MADLLLPLGFVLLWSSSFIAARAGLAYLSPLFFVGLRQTVCAAILLAAMLALRRSFAPLGRRWPHCALSGVLINGVPLMAAHVGMVSVGAGPMALMGALNPILTAALAGPFLGERLRPLQWLGMALGAAGVVVIVGIGARHGLAQLGGLLLGGAGIIGLCGGTLFYARYCRGLPLLPTVTVQYLGASLVSLAGMALLETPRADWTGTAVAALAWNTLAVSIGGVVLYLLMLRRGTAARAAANFYLIPGTTALLGWALLGERLSAAAIAGFVIASAGCWLIARRARPRAR